MNNIESKGRPYDPKHVEVVKGREGFNVPTQPARSLNVSPGEVGVRVDDGFESTEIEEINVSGGIGIDLT
jgi:hypothetical protein